MKTCEAVTLNKTLIDISQYLSMSSGGISTQFHYLLWQTKVDCCKTSQIS